MIAAAVLATSLNLEPGSWLAWIVVGLISGRLLQMAGFGARPPAGRAS